jgi:EAL domain-containing protein (putative c-di-GMP-specific phosphodiesterase class I)
VLDLEITESLVMRDIDENISKLRALNEMGIRVAIDDFGTGYSSLSYLAQLPVYSLKIDRSFVNTMTDSVQSMTIVSTIISLAHSLGMKVTAEGVETEEQAKLLKLLRCDELQGYFFGRPMPAQDIPVFLDIPVEDTRAAGPLQVVRKRATGSGSA